MFPVLSAAAAPNAGRRAEARLRAIAIILAFLPVVGAGASAERATEPTPLGQYYFRNVGAEVGLIAPAVTAAVQTADGYLWVGTQGGLARFDGVRPWMFRTATTPALRSDYIRCLYEDSARTLWIGTDCGLVRYRDGTFTAAGLSDSVITTILRDRRGTLWVGTTRDGLFEQRRGEPWRKHGLELLPHPNIADASIRTLFLDSADRLWVAFTHDAGVAYYQHGAFHPFDADGKVSTRVDAIAEYPRGTLWFALHNEGLVRVREHDATEFTVADGLAGRQVDALVPALDGGMWVAGAGVQRLTDPDRFTLETIQRPAADAVIGIFEDRERNAWLWGGADGLVRMRRLPYAVLSPDGNYPGIAVRSVAEDASGAIWLVDREHHVVRMTRDGRATDTTPEIRAGFEPQTVFTGRDGTLWMIDGQIHAWRENHWERRFPEITDEVHGFYEDRNGRLWVGTIGHGVLRIENGRITPILLARGERIPNTATSFAEGPDGTMWIGLWQGGLVRWRDGQAQRYTRPDGFPGNEVRAVHVDAHGDVWVGVKGRGLAVLHGDRWLNSDPLCEAVANSVTAIAEEKAGRIWLGTPAGLMWARREDLLALAAGGHPACGLHVVGTNDDAHASPVFSGAQPVVWQTADHKLVFASRSGALLVDPDRLPTNTLAPPVRIERVVTDGRPASPDQPVVAAPGNRDLEIEYTALSFVQPSRVTFRYKLEGYDAGWVDAGNRRTAFYTNLPPGSYTFQVQAANADGVWNHRGARVALTQRPRFYQTAWFYTVVLVGIGLLAATLHRWRTARLRRDNDRLERGIAERTQELELANRAILERSRELQLASNAKSEFLETVSHEIRNPLNGLNGLLGLLQQEQLGEPARDLSESVQACARDLTRVFEEVLGFARLEHGNIPAETVVFSLRTLVDDLVRSFAWAARHHHNAISIQFPDDFVDGFRGDATKIKTVVGNFLSNAIKYAPGSAIEVSIEQHPISAGRDDVHVEVRDHGAGIPAAEQELIFKKYVRGTTAREESVAGTGLGLALSRILAARLGGSVGVESTPGDGALFYLSVPLERAEPPPAPTRLSASDHPHPAGRLLIVDDECYNQRVLRGAALELGYTCEIAGTSEEAIRHLGRERFDVVLLDWELPGTKGDAVARWLRAHDAHAGTVIVATTAHDSEKIRRACVEAGMDDFLVKPYDTAEIARCLARARRRAAVERPNGSLDLSAFRLHALGQHSSHGESAGEYLATLRATRDALQAAVDRRDRATIDILAHRLRGLAGMVGAQQLTAAVKEFERVARQVPAVDLGAACGAVSAAVAAVENAIATRDASPHP